VRFKAEILNAEAPLAKFVPTSFSSIQKRRKEEKEEEKENL